PGRSRSRPSITVVWSSMPSRLSTVGATSRWLLVPVYACAAAPPGRWMMTGVRLTTRKWWYSFHMVYFISRYGVSATRLLVAARPYLTITGRCVPGHPERSELASEVERSRPRYIAPPRSRHAERSCCGRDDRGL